jgi:hypothetical protein
MGQIWDSTPTRTTRRSTGKHCLRPTVHQRIARRGLTRLAIAAIVLPTVMGLASVAPVALAWVTR